MFHDVPRKSYLKNPYGILDPNANTHIRIFFVEHRGTFWNIVYNKPIASFDPLGALFHEHFRGTFRGTSWNIVEHFMEHPPTNLPSQIEPIPQPPVDGDASQREDVVLADNIE